MDVGLSGCRVLAISHDGLPLAQARQTYAPERNSDGDLSLDLSALWEAVQAAVAEAAQRTRSDRPQAICITSSSLALVPLAAEGGALAPPVLSAASLPAEEPRGGFGGLSLDQVVHTLGDRPPSISALRALCDWRHEQPQLYAHTWRAVPLATLVAFRLGGACLVDASMAAAMHMLDVATGAWSSQALRAAGLGDVKLPEIAPAATLLGTVARPAAERLGLGRELRIVLGGADYACAALGVGALQTGQGLLSLDRVVSILAAYEALPLVGLLYSHGLNTVLHVAPERWLSQVLTSSGGNVLHWLRDAWLMHEAREAAARGHDFYRRLMDEMPAEPTSLVAIPPPDEALLGGAGAPATAGVWGISGRTTRGEVVKAFLEGVMLACMPGLDALRAAGIMLETLRATGPGARSEPWLQLAADVLGIEVVETGVLYPAPLGAAMLAGVGVGAYSSLREAIDIVVRPQRRYEPRAKHTEAYAALRERYRAIADGLSHADG